jgi:hypothetical protein
VAQKEAGLSTEFDAEVYGAMDALIRVEEALLADAAGGAAGGEEVEGLVGGGAGVEVGVQDGGDSGEAEVGKEQVQEDASAGQEEEEEEPQEEKEEEEDVDEDGEEMQEDGGNADASNDLGLCKSSTYVLIQFRVLMIADSLLLLTKDVVWL